MNKDELIKLTDSIYQMEREIEAINIKLKPAREKLLGALDYGAHILGDHIATKEHVDECYVKAFTRKPFDRLKVK